ncbi:conserved hypothetical protein [Thiocapsa sp. KS1]|nr:conserved hypothetical protein [Thiocapsa sp. KS1]
MADRLESRCRLEQTSTAAQGYSKLHPKLRRLGKLNITPGKAFGVLTEDTPFSTPSAASAVILGRSDNGRTSWKIEGT